mgnify:CR=1 FL=1
MATWHLFFPNSEQLVGLCAVLAILAGFFLIGGAISGNKRFSAVDTFVGWGIAYTVFTLGGVFGKLPFTWLTVGLLVILIPSALAIYKKKSGNGLNPEQEGLTWKLLVLSLPLLLVAAAMKASQWDEFAHWLPNTQYIFRHDGFPGSGMPPIQSAHPAYPYGLPLITYLASKLNGQFIENGSAIANVALHIVLAPVYLSVIRRGLGKTPAWSQKWGIAALGILGVTVLSTTFIQKLVFTAYADATTSVVLAATGVLGWKILDVVSANKPESLQYARTLAWQFSWVSVVLLAVKQSNLALFGLLLVGIGVVAISDRSIKAIKILKLAPLMVSPAIVVYLTWRYHVGIHMPDGEHVILPFAQWHLADSWTIISNMFGVALRKGAFFAMMVIVILTLIYTFFKKNSVFPRFGLISAIVFIGFNVFLLFVYLTVFERTDSVNVISYWRFNTQLGLLGCTTAAYGFAIFWRNNIGSKISNSFLIKHLLPLLAVVTVIAAPLVAIETLRFDLRPQNNHIRLVGQEMAAMLLPESRLKVIDPNGSGFVTTVIRYEMTNGNGAEKNISVPPGFDNYRDGRSLGDPAQDPNLTHAWVFQPYDKIDSAFGQPLKAGASHLLKKNGNEWRLLKSWPYEGFEDPYGLPD